MPNKKRKLKKSNDSTKCCLKCAFFNNSNKEDTICSLDGKSVQSDGICKSFDSTVTMRCDRCNREVKYNSKEEYYNNVIHFEMRSGSGSSSGQNIHLCSKCGQYAWDKYQDYLEDLKKSF